MSTIISLICSRCSDGADVALRLPEFDDNYNHSCDVCRRVAPANAWCAGTNGADIRIGFKRG